MKLNKVTKTIKGNNYEIGYLPAMYNTNLFIKFSSIIGGSLANFFSSSLNNNDFSYIGEGINKIMTSIYINDPQGAIILDILSQTTRNGVAISKITFDEFYTGNIEEMVDVLYESMVVHFKPFLPIDKITGFLERGEGNQQKVTEI